MRRARFFLDANILVDAQLRDLLLTAASFEVIDVRWSSTVLDEVRRALTQKLGLQPLAVDRLIQTMERSAPDSSVEAPLELIESFHLPDPDDRHVAASAVNSECDVLMTANVRDFPEEQFERYDILIATPDEALALLVGGFGEAVPMIIDSILGRFKNPSISPQEYVDRLVKKAPTTGLKIGALASPDEYGQLWQDAYDASSETSGHEIVRQLIESLERGDEQSIEKLLSPGFISSLRESGTDRFTLADALRKLLPRIGTGEGWGFATAKRPVALDRSVVLLTRSGPQVIRTPTQLPAYRFELVMFEDRWMVDAINPNRAE